MCRSCSPRSEVGCSSGKALIPLPVGVVAHIEDVSLLSSLVRRGQPLSPEELIDLRAH